MARVVRGSAARGEARALRDGLATGQPRFEPARDALAARLGARDRAARSELSVVDLMVNSSWVWDQLVIQANCGQWLDAFLCCAAAHQMLEDSLHSPGSSARRAASLLSRSPSAIARTLGATASGALRAGELARTLPPATRQVARHRAELASLASSLARAARSTRPITEAEARDLQSRALRSAEVAGRARARLRNEVIRLPACFRSFDQHPADIETLVDRLAAREPDLDRPIAVVGVRTSGSYLAPLAAARLGVLGYRRVITLSVRPGVRLDRGDRRRLAAVVAANGLAIVVDDPPVAGNALATVARTLEASGVPRAAVLLMLATASVDGKLPKRLDPYARIVLPRSEWDIERRLEPRTVRATLVVMLGPGSLIHELTPISEPECDANGDRRDHRRAIFDARFERSDGEIVGGRVIAEGVGLGWFGRHALEVGDRVPGWVPELLGFDDGVLYQLVRGPILVDAVGPEVIADYLAERARALRVGADRSVELNGRQTVWEVAAEIVEGTLGPAGLLTRLPLVGPMTRALLRVREPSVIDGSISPRFWIGTPTDTATGAWRKLDFADRAFSHRELLSYDAAFDVASPLDDEPARDRELTARGRARWEAQSGRAIQPEKWLLYRLVHLWEHRRRGASVSWSDRRVSCALQDYVAEVYLAELVPARGPWCALDVDGVLETGVLGGSAPGPMGAVVLRSLIAHGFRVVLATGRSADEVRDRCSAWRLPGGVAEYGTALVHGGEVVDLRTPVEIAVIDGVRRALADLDGVELDPAYHHIVRAFHVDAHGRRTGLSDDDCVRVRAGLDRPGAIQLLPGEDQTDIAPVGCNKGTGVRALLARLDPEVAARVHPLALAVGDGVADLPLLAAAATAAAPRHASIAAEPGVRVTRHSYQAGLADAVALELGHPAGACPKCRLDQPIESRALFGLLSLRQAGPAAFPRQFVRAALDGRRVARARIRAD